MRHPAWLSLGMLASLLWAPLAWAGVIHCDRLNVRISLEDGFAVQNVQVLHTVLPVLLPARLSEIPQPPLQLPDPVAVEQDSASLADWARAQVAADWWRQLVFKRFLPGLACLLAASALTWDQLRQARHSTRRRCRTTCRYPNVWVQCLILTLGAFGLLLVAAPLVQGWVPRGVFLVAAAVLLSQCNPFQEGLAGYSRWFKQVTALSVMVLLFSLPAFAVPGKENRSPRKPTPAAVGLDGDEVARRFQPRPSTGGAKGPGGKAVASAQLDQQSAVALGLLDGDLATRGRGRLKGLLGDRNSSGGVARRATEPLPGSSAGGGPNRPGLSLNGRRDGATARDYLSRRGGRFFPLPVLEPEAILLDHEGLEDPGSRRGIAATSETLVATRETPAAPAGASEPRESFPQLQGPSLEELTRAVVTVTVPPRSVLVSHSELPASGPDESAQRNDPVLSVKGLRDGIVNANPVPAGAPVGPSLPDVVVEDDTVTIGIVPEEQLPEYRSGLDRYLVTTDPVQNGGLFAPPLGLTSGTPLDPTVQLAPEPHATVMLSMGVCVVLGYRWRGRARSAR